MTEALFAARWYVVAQVFGLAALPLSRVLLRHLPDGGYGAAKSMGLLLSGWVFWILGVFGWLPTKNGAVLASIALVLCSGLVFTFRARRSAFHQRASDRWPDWRVVIATEIVFTSAFIAWCLVRARMPRILTAGGEKWMEVAFLRAILRSDTFPPHDPWLSGFAISYYYFGYVLITMVVRLAAVPAAVGFNLGVALLFALACTGAFSLVYNLIAAERRSEGGWAELGGGLLGAALLAIVGNLEGLLEVLHARGLGPAAFWRWLDIRGLSGPPPPVAEGSWVPDRFFWWWQASRVVRDYTPWGEHQEVIDEFPAFSFILGDMHPHVLGLPFVLLAIVLALNLYLAVRRQRMAGATQSGNWLLTRVFVLREWPLRVWEFAVYALCLGGLGFLNTWDFPIYLFVVAAAYGLALVQRREGTARGYLAATSLLFLALLAAGVALYLPFWIGFQSQAGGLLINLFNATRLPHFLVMFGPLVFINGALIVGEARRWGVRAWPVAKWTLISTAAVVVALSLVLGALLLLVTLGVVPPTGVASHLWAWLTGEPIAGIGRIPNLQTLVSAQIARRLLNPWTALVLFATLATLVLVMVHRLGRPRPAGDQFEDGGGAISRDFVLLLIATGGLLTLSVEYVYLRDHFGTRMNTVFKFYFQAWVVWSIAGGYAWWTMARKGRAIVVATMGVLVFGGLIYPLLAIPARYSEYGAAPTLDGAAYLAQTNPDDYAAIAWLNQYVDDAPVILEAPADQFGAYTYAGRVSAHTGLPALLGWAGHEHQWRGDYAEQARREEDIQTLYSAGSVSEVQFLLDEYDITYVYVGPLERERYPAAGLRKFRGQLRAVYDVGAVTIYQR
jgi:YYY domain-containing protein